MIKTSSAKKRIPPEAFSQHRRAAFERTVQLTQKAIAQLQAQGQTVTLSALSEATRTFDENGKGLEPNTILRNPEAAELFRQQSPAYQRRQERAKKAKRKRPSVTVAQPEALSMKCLWFLSEAPFQGIVPEARKTAG